MYAFTKEHETIVLAIYTSASITPPLFSAEKTEIPINTVKALWDTGATHSAISNRLAGKLNLPIEDFARVTTASGIQHVPVYLIRVTLPGSFSFDEIEAVEFTYTDEDDCDLIVGMDVMTQGDLAISNYDGKTVFSFRIPSFERLDFA
ncbi:MAG: retroviral-like aspartic protease family protein [Saprospiraceae bacterium]|nr:retroviral-like aspartic protease family protein [Saprospiraceae bacterium]